MGTNIYLVKQITKKQINSLKTTFNTVLQELQYSSDIDATLEILQEELNKLRDRVHICKRSAGWQLLFQSHKDLYDCTWDSMYHYIKKVLDEGTYIMVDEYGALYSLQDLKEDLKRFSKGHTGESYSKYLKSQGKQYSYEAFEYISDGLRWADKEFS